jgi:DNA-binding CsgD family transcriptional regulator
LIAAADGFRAERGIVIFPVDQPMYDKMTANCRDALGVEAFEAARADGAAMTLDEAVAYAQRGRGQRNRPATGWDSLTPVELDVVRLASQGLSNPQIAERLFVSRHTVKVHLSHVFAKLDVSSRTELAAEATRRGI